MGKDWISASECESSSSETPGRTPMWWCGVCSGQGEVASPATPPGRAGQCGVWQSWCARPQLLGVVKCRPPPPAPVLGEVNSTLVDSLEPEPGTREGNGSHEMLRVTSQVSSDSFIRGARQLFILQLATFIKAIHSRHFTNTH